MEKQRHDYKKILIPVEELQLSESIIDFVAGYRWNEDAQFRILHVRELIPPVAPMGGIPVILPDGSYEEGLKIGRSLVDSLVRRLGSTIQRKVEGFVEEDSVREAIIRNAEEWSADLILMATHGRHGLERWLLGSMSNAVVERAPCSIIILHTPQTNAA